MTNKQLLDIVLVIARDKYDRGITNSIIGNYKISHDINASIKSAMLITGNFSESYAHLYYLLIKRLYKKLIKQLNRIKKEKNNVEQVRPSK